VSPGAGLWASAQSAKPMAVSAVVGREPELDRLREFLAESALQGLVLRGDPGIGKTILWQFGVDEATARGSRVLVHRAVEAEAGLAFTGIADLVGPVLAEVEDQLAPPRLRALRVALLLEDPGAEPPQPEAIGLAVLDVLTLLSADARVVVAIDDLQWLDSSSSSVLPLALRRLRGKLVSLLVSIRDASGVRPPFEPAALLGEDGVVEVRVPALGLSEMHRLLSDGAGVDLPRPDLVRIHEASGGNPLFALELARSGEGRLPANLREALDERLDRLPQPTADVLLEAAALARPTIAAIAEDTAKREALGHALDARVIELDGEAVRFTHPLLAARCYERATPWQRRDVHGALARKVSDVEQHARHLALASDGTDETVAAELDSAVANAAARGATAAAAELADLAVRLTPGDAVGRRSAAAHFHHLAGDFGRATELYAQLAEELPPGVERADALYLRALVGRERLPERARLCEQALQEAESDDARCADIHGFLAITRWLLGDVPAALAEARVGRERAERTGDPRTLAVALGRVGLMELWALEITPGLLERGAALEAALPEPLLFVESPAFILATALTQLDELDRSREMFDAFLATAVARGDEHTRQWTVLQLIHLEWAAGRLHLALDHADASREIADQTGEAQFAGMVARSAAFVEADLGLIDEARA
jgi:tetratricopeptide (TPR) repeat protein